MRKRAFLANALVVDVAARTFHFGLLHLYTEVFFSPAKIPVSASFVFFQRKHLVSLHSDFES
jgi:hypothetical protein